MRRKKMKVKLLSLGLCCLFALSMFAGAQGATTKQDDMKKQDTMMKKDKKEDGMEHTSHMKRRHHRMMRRHHRMMRRHHRRMRRHHRMMKKDTTPKTQ